MLQLKTLSQVAHYIYIYYNIIYYIILLYFPPKLLNLLQFYPLTAYKILYAYKNLIVFENWERLIKIVHFQRYN